MKRILASAVLSVLFYGTAYAAYGVDFSTPYSVETF